MYERPEKPKRGRIALLALVLAAVLGTTALAASAQRMLVPGGHTVGVKLFARGVMVVKLTDGGTPAKECGLKTGDVIVECGGTAVTSTEQFQSLLQKNGTKTTDLAIKRDGSPMTLSVEPERNENGVYCIGAWIRDSMAGIGTLTYYDPENATFGALGHGITDCDTAQLMPFARGSILPSTVKAVKKGTSGAAGELRGDFDLERELGSLYANTANGIFGQWSGAPAAEEAIPIGQATAGKAIIRSNVTGDSVEEYAIEITRVDTHSTDGRELTIQVTDPKLIGTTGGIVQGMSGSPILQNGKLVGAVTHVLLNDPCKGYGILIDTMLKSGKTA